MPTSQRSAQWVKRAEAAEAELRKSLDVMERHIVRADRMETALRSALEALQHALTYHQPEHVWKHLESARDFSIDTLLDYGGDVQRIDALECTGHEADD